MCQLKLLLKAVTPNRMYRRYEGLRKEGECVTAQGRYGEFGPLDFFLIVTFINQLMHSVNTVVDVKICVV